MTVLLPVVGATVGSIAGWLVFTLAQREERTSLPASWRWPMAGVSGALCGVLVVVRGAAELPAFALLVLLGILLATVDLRHQLLPNRLVLPFLGLAVLLLSLPALVDSTWQRLPGAVLGSLALFGVYLIAALSKPGGIGMGDVKLAAVVGLYAGYQGLASWIAVLLGAFLLNSLVIIVLMLARVLKRDSDIPFGPSMIAVALLVSLAG